MTAKKHRLRLLDGYVRVSDVAGREGDSYITEDVQEEKIRGWIELNDHKLGEIFTDRNISGGVLSRPGLDEILRRVEDGESEGVVVYNTSRFSRSLENTVMLLRRLSDRGAVLVSVQEQFDLSTWQGRMVFNILQSIAEGQREQIKENWAIAGEKAAERRVPPQKVAFGYRKMDVPKGHPDHGRFEPDPDTGWVVTELFKRRARREGWKQIRDWLVETGVQPRYGGSWAKTTVWGMVRSRTYLGEVAFDGRVYTDMHEPLTDPVTWAEANEWQPRAAHDTTPSRLLSGLCRCAGCRYSMGAASNTGLYSCKRAPSAGDCPTPAYMAGYTTEWVQDGRRRVDGLDGALDLLPRRGANTVTREEIIEHLERDGTSIERFKSTLGLGRKKKADAPVRDELKKKLRGLHALGASHRLVGDVLGIHHGSVQYILGRRPNRRVVGLDDYVVAAMFKHLAEREDMARIEAERVNPAVDLEPMADALRAARAELDSYAQAEGQIREAGGLDAYLVGLRARREKMEDAQRGLDEALRQAARPDRPVRELREDWDDMSTKERRDLLASVIQCVFVRPSVRRGGGEGASAERVHIVWADEPEVDVPRQGRRDYVLRPYVFPADDADGPDLAGEAAA